MTEATIVARARATLRTAHTGAPAPSPARHEDSSNTRRIAPKHRQEHVLVSGSASTTLTLAWPRGAMLGRGNR